MKKIILCIGLLVSGFQPVVALSNPLTLEETSDIRVFVSKVSITLIAADRCLAELIVKRKKGLDCRDYETKIMALNKSYRPVMSIKPPQKRYKAIAGNNAWYKSFRDYDQVVIVVSKINQFYQ